MRVPESVYFHVCEYVCVRVCVCVCVVESVLPNYWETISGIPPDSSTWSGGLGLGNTSCRGALNRSA
jgi:hypothetical protein